jgi:hypothetical protein
MEEERRRRDAARTDPLEQVERLQPADSLDQCIGVRIREMVVEERFEVLKQRGAFRQASRGQHAHDTTLEREELVPHPEQALELVFDHLRKALEKGHQSHGLEGRMHVCVEEIRQNTQQVRMPSGVLEEVPGGKLGIHRASRACVREKTTRFLET